MEKSTLAEGRPKCALEEEGQSQKVACDEGEGADGVQIRNHRPLSII